MKLSYEGIGQWAATFACAEAGGGRIGEDQRERRRGRLRRRRRFLRDGAVGEPGRRRLLRGPGRHGDRRVHRRPRPPWAGAAWSPTAPAASRPPKPAGNSWWWTWTTSAQTVTFAL